MLEKAENKVCNWKHAMIKSPIGNIVSFSAKLQNIGEGLIMALAKGIKEGCELTREIIKMQIPAGVFGPKPKKVSKYLVSKMIGVEPSTVYAWQNNINAPEEENYQRLIALRKHLETLMALKPFGKAFKI